MEDNLFLDKNYWDHRYSKKNTGWDIGKSSTPLIKYFEQLKNKKLKILIPGCGLAHEAEHLINEGFKNVYLLDFATKPIIEFKKKVPHFPKENLITDDFFNHHSNYDLIIEQTFFCALHPSLRKKYVTHSHSLLKNGGKIVGVLFNDNLKTEGPPFVASKNDYVKLFKPYFKLKVIETCNNSIPQRKENELFIIFIKR